MSLDRRAMESALPGYEIGRELGRGAFGLVFEGRHRQLDRKVAIKQLPRALATDPTARQRFLTESRTVAALQHPHIVPVYDFVEHDGLHLLVMEHLGGGSLADRATTPMPTGEACAIAMTIASALQHAHDRGVLHRDVKPDNVLFTTDGVAKLADFGIAKLVEQPTRLTMTGTVVGTPAYMAPEVALGEEAGPAADVYALGVVLYELLAHRLPYPERSTAAAALLQRVNEDPAPLQETAPHVPPALAEVVMRAIARNPADRFTSAGALAAALSPFTSAAAAPDAPSTPAAAHPTMAPLGVVVPERLPVARSRRRTRVGATAVALVLVVVVAVVAVLSGGGGDGETTGATEAGGTTTASVTSTSAEAGGPNAILEMLTDATARFRTFCQQNYTAAQCQCAIDRIQREIGLAAFVDVTNDLATTGRTNRSNAVAIIAQCASR
jgi:hypothetical protein